MTRAIAKLDNEISTLCLPRIIDPPKPKELKEEPISNGFSFAVIFGIVGAVIGGIVGGLGGGMGAALGVKKVFSFFK